MICQLNITFLLIILLLCKTLAQINNVTGGTSTTGVTLPKVSSTNSVTTTNPAVTTTSSNTQPSVNISSSTIAPASNITKISANITSSTTISTTPIITTTPYIVNEIFADFSMSCDNITCTYSIQSPALSEAWINELQTVQNMTSIDSSSYNTDNTILKDYQNQTQKLCNLTEYNNLYNELIGNLSNIQQSLKDFNNYYDSLNKTYTNLTTYLNQFPAYNCYYYCKSFKPITTFTTPAPPSTTLFDPCSKQICDAEIDGNNYKGQCVRNGFSSYCKCPGNLDPYNSCQNVGCYSTTNGKPDMLLNGPIWSPGYLGQIISNTTYQNGQICSWQIKNIVNVQNLNLSVNKFQLADGSSLTISTDIMTVTFTNAYDIDSIRETIASIIEGASFIKIKFKAGKSISPDTQNYFDLYLNGTNPIITTTVPTTTQPSSITTTEDECNGHWVTVDYISYNEYSNDNEKIMDNAISTLEMTTTTINSQTTPGMTTTKQANSQTTQKMTTKQNGLQTTSSTKIVTPTKKTTRRICVTDKVTSSMSTSTQSIVTKGTTLSMSSSTQSIVTKGVTLSTTSSGIPKRKAVMSRTKECSSVSEENSELLSYGKKNKTKRRRNIVIDSDDDDETHDLATVKKRKIPKVCDEDSYDDEVNEGNIGAIRKAGKVVKEPKPPKIKKQKVEDTKQTKLEFFLTGDKSKKSTAEKKQNPELKSVSAADYFASSSSTKKTKKIDEDTSNVKKDSPKKELTKINSLNGNVNCVENGKKDSPKKKLTKEESSINKDIVTRTSPRKRTSNTEVKENTSVKKLEVTDSNIDTIKKKKINNVETQKVKNSPKKAVKNDTVKLEKPLSNVSTKTTQPSVVQKPKDQIWVDKYSPKTLKELINQTTDKSPANKLLHWLKCWKENNLGENGKVKKVKPTGLGAKNDGTAFKAALLSGSPGVGKTTCAVLACKELGLTYVQLNASDARGKKILQQKVEECLQTHNISSFFKSTNNPGKNVKQSEQVLIMDEVDGMSGSDDRAGISELILMIKNTKIPIICICNDRFNRKIQSLANHCFDLRFTKPTVNQVRARLMAIASKEGMKIPLEKMSQVAEASNLDIRQSIYNLQLIKSSGQVEQLNSKDVAVNIFEAARQLLDPKTSNIDRRRLYFTDYSIMPLFVQENYVSIEPVKLNRKETLKALKKSAEALSYVDVFEKQIRTNQVWELLNDQCTFAGILVPNYMQGYLSEQLAFPSHLGKISTTNKRYRMLRQLIYHMSTKLTVDETSLVTEILPTLRRQLADPLIKKGVDGIPEVINLYNQYCLTKEDHEFIIELTDWSNSEEIEKNIPSKVKAAFTRALNKEDRKLPYADLANDVVKISKGKKSSKKEVIKDDDSQSSSDDETTDLIEFDY
ncbi:Replication factor C subunit 1 [Strongyloides ratti]|uniref:Replication factor C subunit 1 n=1 Tax=Strongyloides ratti TaxID=34506 RepID=A0A090LKF1_STRRB|nr:Replication factor C subunit 1 [Strongyloides ratti]CEF68035.1 Replication factor C subunit 1 [Strongyloides ratti]